MQVKPSHLHIGAYPLPVAKIRKLADRPRQLCMGCPHTDTFAAMKKALESFERRVVTSDIGCYALGVLPPYSMGETLVCMGASIGIAKGTSEAGYRPAIAVIGDSTFLHSGISPLVDAYAADTDMTVMIMDNEAVGMTGGPATVLPSLPARKSCKGNGR